MQEDKALSAVTLTCLCGAITVQTARRPDFIFECNCSLCSKTGARWGYFHPDAVTVHGDSASFQRADKAEPATDIHFCVRCGCTTHFTLTPAAIARLGNTMLGVNMWLADPDALAGLELQFPDGRSWSGDGPFGFVRPPIVLGVERPE